MRKFNNRLQDALAFAEQKGITVRKRVKGETETSIQVGAVRVFIRNDAPNNAFWMLSGAPYPYRYNVGDAIVKAVRVQVEPELRRPASEATEALFGVANA